MLAVSRLVSGSLFVNDSLLTPIPCERTFTLLTLVPTVVLHGGEVDAGRVRLVNDSLLTPTPCERTFTLLTLVPTVVLHGGEVDAGRVETAERLVTNNHPV